jgi:type IV pilus assembly protein PilN
MRFTINLATRRYINQRAVSRSLAAVMLVAVITAGFNAYLILSNAREMGTVGDQLTASAGRYQKSTGVSEQEYNALLASISFVNNLLERKNREWLLIFDRLEGTVPDGVALTSLEPDMKDRLLKLKGEASSFGRLRKFVENMQGSSNFRDVTLESHAVEKGEGDRPVVLFSISCRGDFL